MKTAAGVGGTDSSGRFRTRQVTKVSLRGDRRARAEITYFSAVAVSPPKRLPYLTHFPVKLSLIAPTFNEAENVGRLFAEVDRRLREVDYEIIISDDNSPDRTWEVAERMAATNPRVRVLRRASDPGLTRSVIDGFTLASGEIVACMDADLQHDPVILPQMLQVIAQGQADIAIGSRYVEGGSTGTWKIVRRVPSWAATKMAQVVLGVEIYDPLSGYFMLRRDRFLQIRERLRGSGFKVLLEIVANSGNCRIQEIPYTFRPRLAGKSKLTRRVVMAYLVQLWELWRAKR